MPSCLIIVENLPVPLDRRVWQEACALRDAGWTVAVICPRTERHPERELTLENIQIYRHDLPVEGRGALGFVAEYGAALFHELRLALRAWRRCDFDVVHICNPPDLLFLTTLPFKLFGKRVIFDHHDICPELYVSKFERRDWLHRALGVFERMTFRAADVVISANETFRQLAISRGGKAPDDVFTVYGIPDRSRFRRIDCARRPGDPVVIGYVGVLGKQDGVDNLIRAAAEIRTRRGFDRFLCRVVGDGPEMANLKRLSQDLDLNGTVEFTGFRTGDDFLQQLSSFDIGVIPDPYDEYNDKISMNKVFEYSTLGIPLVSYRLSETMRLLGDAGTYAGENSVAALADAIHELAQDPERRAERGAAAAALAHERFSWANETVKLLAAYERALNKGREAYVEPREAVSEAVSKAVLTRGR